MRELISEGFKINHPDLYERVMASEYDFLDNDPHLGDRVALLCLSGSYAYGLATKDSDLDIRGVALNSREEILGLSNFEQFLNTATDTTIYGMKKFIKLMTECNPNIIEMLYCRPCDYLYISPVGQLLLDNRNLFLSQRAVRSFLGYATAQIKRIENKTARDRLSEYKKQEHIASGAQNAVDNYVIQHELDDFGSMTFKVDEQTTTLMLDCSYENLPVANWLDLMNGTKQVLDNYNKTMGRNKKKDDAHLCKHFSHVIRLLRMGKEILTEHCVHTYRENDKDFLFDIKKGKYMNEDGLFDQFLWDDAYQLTDEMRELEKTTTLQKTYDFKAVEALTMKINELSL